MLENAYMPMYLRVEGMLMLSRDAQLLKYYISILEIFSLSVSVFRDVHPLNAYESIMQELSHVLKLTVLGDVQPSKHCDDIRVSLLPKKTDLSCAQL